MWNRSDNESSPRGRRGPSRRDVLRMGAAGGAIALSGGARVFASPAGPGGRDVLVFVFLRGGADGLSIVVPYQDADLYAFRPTLGVQQADVVDLDGFFGFNRVAQPLVDLYRAGNLAIVHAVGSLNPTRSHFEAMRRIEQGAIFGGTLPDGWLARHLRVTAPADPLATGRAVAVDRVLPTSMQGSPDAIPISRLSEFTLGGPASTRLARRARLESMLAAAPAPDGPLGSTTLGLIEAFDPLDFAGRPVGPGIAYPDSSFGRALYEAATVIKSGISIEAIEIDMGDWDHHGLVGPLNGRLATRLDDLARGLRAFMDDLGTDRDRVTLVCHSEFGRRVDENGSAGFDHGRGGIAMVLGGAHVHGGQVYGTWPGLSMAQQDDKALSVTTDIRHVIGEVLVRRLQTADLGAVLPGYTPGFLGLVS